MASVSYRIWPLPTSPGVSHHSGLHSPCSTHHGFPLSLECYNFIILLRLLYFSTLFARIFFLSTSSYGCLHLCTQVSSKVASSSIALVSFIWNFFQNQLLLWTFQLYKQSNSLSFFLKFNFIYLFIYLWLCWVFVSVRGLSPVVASGGHSSSRCAGLSLSRPLLLRSTGSRRAGSVVVAHGPSCSAACGIFPDQGSNPCPLHWQADSQPLRHQGSPNSLSFIKPIWSFFSLLQQK